MIFGAIHIQAIQNIFLNCSCRAKFKLFSTWKNCHVINPVGRSAAKSVIFVNLGLPIAPWMLSIGFIEDTSSDAPVNDHNSLKTTVVLGNGRPRGH